MVKKKWIAVIIIVVVIIAAIAIIDSTIPSKNQVSVTVSKVIDDHADEVMIGHPGDTAYIVSVSIKYTGSGSLSEYPFDFYFVTSNGTVSADSSGFFSNVTAPLKSSSLSAGQSISGQIYDSFPNNVTISSIYYSYDGQHYAAPSIPSVSQWVSYIHDVTVNVNDNNLSAVATLTYGDYNSGTVVAINISLTSFTLISTSTVSSITVSDTSITSYSYTPKLPINIGAGDIAYILLNITMPNESIYYSNININIDASTS